MSRAGRRRAALARREANGQARRESAAQVQDQIIGVVLAQPHRRGERSQMVAYALGRLRHSGQISQEQFNALETYARLASRYMREVLGSSYHWPRSSIANMSGGTRFRFEADPHQDGVAQIQRDWADVMSAFADNGLLYSGTAALAHICLMDMDPSQNQLGNARLAANVLHRLWGSRPNRRHAPVRFDAEFAS